MYLADLAYLDEFFCSVVHFVVPLDVGDDARHVDLALEGRGLAGLGGHVVHNVLNVWLPAGFDWKETQKAMRLA